MRSVALLPSVECTAEPVAGEVVLRIHTTQEAERRCQDVIRYLRRLLGSSLGCEVRPLPLARFGSAPITPLPLAHPRFIATPPLPVRATPRRPPHQLDSPRRRSLHPSSSPPLTVVPRSGRDEGESGLWWWSRRSLCWRRRRCEGHCYRRSRRRSRGHGARRQQNRSCVVGCGGDPA